MIIASLYSKPVNKSIAFHYGQKNNGYSAFIPNTRYLVYQPRLTDAIIVIFGLLSYEHPCKGESAFSLFAPEHLFEKIGLQIKIKVIQ